jgi:3-mercaptopyruvate sulfurtransferase SseA
MPSKNAPNNNIPLFLICGGVVLIIGLLIWQLLIQPPAAAPAANTGGNIPFASVQRVSLANAKAALDSKTAVFVDVRDLDIYKANHINGAINIPSGEIETRYRELDPKQWIITYCT